MNTFRAVTCGAVVSLLALATAAAGDGSATSNSEPLHKLTVRVLDADGKPVSGAHVGVEAFFGHRFLTQRVADADGFRYGKHCLSDANGLAQVESGTDDLRQSLKKSCIVARHDGRGLTAIADFNPEESKTRLDVTLVPQCRVSGKLVCEELAKRSRRVGWTNVEICVGKKQVMMCASENEGEFHFFLPPGSYKVHAYGTYLSHTDQAITIPPGERELSARLAVLATRFALLQGLPAPELRDIVAWKNSQPLKIFELRGKCVLLDFWGHWCGPCVEGMPWTFHLHDRLAKTGLVVIGIHVEVVADHPVDSVRRLDEKLVSIRKELWHGRDIPYPVALARPTRPCTVVKDYGIDGFPTLLLIDRRGNIVDEASGDDAGLALVEKCLAEKPPVVSPRREVH